jgi:hypothetical protein
LDLGVEGSGKAVPIVTPASMSLPIASLIATVPICIDRRFHLVRFVNSRPALLDTGSENLAGRPSGAGHEVRHAAEQQVVRRLRVRRFLALPGGAIG